MAKKKHRNRPQRPRSTAQPAHAVRQSLPEARVTKGAPREPAFWFGFEIPWAKLVVLRFALFGVLAVDALLQISHAPKYGANDFNVAQFAFLDHVAPGRVTFGVGQLVMAYLLILAAFGIATRIALPIVTAIYAWFYFSSQLDSFQHHYLVSLVLLIACFVPWEPAATPVRSWALRLLLVELAIVYFWAAISKLDPLWLDGTTLAKQLGGGVRALVESTIGFQVAAIIVVATELALAAMIWMRRTWKLAAPLGIAFHIGILATGFEIGLFAFLMLALYILVLPDRWFRWTPRTLQHGKPWHVLAAAIVLGAGAAFLVRFPDAVVAALVLSLVPLAIAFRWQATLALALAHLTAIGLWIAVDRTTSTAFDYYKFWSGTHRRLAENDDKVIAHRHRDLALDAYRQFVAFDPSSANARFHLGRILIELGQHAEGLEHLREAQRLDPMQARAFIEEAYHQAEQNNHDLALTAARGAVAAEPNNPEAASVVDTLQRRAPLKRPRRSSSND